MIKHLIILLSVTVYAVAAQAANVAYRSNDELDPADATFPTSSLMHGALTHAGGDSEASPISPEQKIDETIIKAEQKKEETTAQAAFDPFVPNARDAEMTGFDYYGNPQSQFKLIKDSRELIGKLGDDDEALIAVFDDTLTLAQQVNEFWNSLDSQLTVKFYQGLDYVGVSDSFDAGDNLNNRQNTAAFNDEILEIKLMPEATDAPASGVHSFMLKLPRLLTINNILLSILALLTCNGLFRVMRFVLLRL
ncbi:MAG: hypothetical protein CVV13_07500 [Gammaproteobacteria bacterium HGW-Gammaproteobacteria-3]|nr:MAG: hypothetical protein CVV13_07500 [Gammaproteobacteria bacterium HGW-Gammaproteobacteria-3]